MTTAEDPLVQIAGQCGLLPPGSDLPTSWLERARLGRSVADELGLPWIELGDRLIPREVLAALPRALVLEHKIMPFALEQGFLHVAVSDPIAVDRLDSLAFVAEFPLRPALAAATDIRQAIDRAYGWDLSGLADNGRPESSGRNDATSVQETDAPIIRLVQEIIADAIRRRASDLHFEPQERRFRVRYRIDGVMQEAEAPAKRLQLPVISRLKLMAGISISEKRLPQDGRIQVVVDGRTVDLRVSSLPTTHGETVVLRILDKVSLELGLPELGFLPDDQAIFEQQITSPDGMVLVTGPTGSGKTTTLYASLHRLNQPDRKIITVEDPVEYQISGINQVPVNPGIGMSFAAALRAMLRQAPNLIMVGEIRDSATAEIAINASLTGHMVFSTLHTNDAPSAVTRLIDIGVKPFLVAASLRSVVAQRLVRRICPDCKQSYTPSAHELQMLGLKGVRLEGAGFARGAGCPACSGTGFRGRLGIFEIFLVHDGIRAMIYDNVTATRLRHQARKDGMRTMREDGLRKVLAGLTTIEEIVSVTIGDQS